MGDEGDHGMIEISGQILALFCAASFMLGVSLMGLAQSVREAASIAEGPHW